MAVEINRPAANPAPAKPESPLHKAAQHESGLRHATGEAQYVDDLPTPPNAVVGWLVTSPIARGRITKRDASRARAVPGVRAVLLAEDVPGDNMVGPVVHDEPLFADKEVSHVGQAVALVVGDTYEACRAGAKAMVVEYEEQEPVLTIPQAIEKGWFLCTPHHMRRGDVDEAFAMSALRFKGEVETGGQDHFYLETHASLAVPEEGGCVRVFSSTQHPSEVQTIVGRVLGVGRHQVVVECPRMGGGFGGKETQAAPFAAMAALAARKLNRPCKVWLNRDTDMAGTGKRHPFWSRFEAGFDREGRIQALVVEMYANGGYSVDLSQAILDRGMFHLDNCYWIPNLQFTGQACKTNLPSNTAFRGFGGPQGMVVVEEVMTRAAERLGLDPALVRERNLYGPAPQNRTPYDQEVIGDRMPRIHAELIASSDYAKRRAEVEAFNAQSRHTRRGLAFGPVKFGISFTNSMLNQAGAYVVLYTDGTAQLNHGGTEMGQGLHTKMLAICAHELGVSTGHIRAMNTSTEKVPNTSATAASSGADLNGQAVREACVTLRERLRPIAAKLLSAVNGDAEQIAFASDRAWLGGKSVLLADVTRAAYVAQVSMSATGYYRTPNIHYDREAGRGKPFHYFAYGAAVCEVEVSALTGEFRLKRVDILHDVGDSLVPSIDRGQVEGAFIQGFGWLTCEEVLFDKKGRLLTHSPDTYKIPALGEAPEDFRVALLERAPQDNTIHGSKAVGEPPLMLAIAAVGALRHAIGSFGPLGREVKLRIPCTPEAVLFSIEAQRGR